MAEQDVNLLVTLPPDQLAEVLSAPTERRRQLFISGLIHTKNQTLTLVRGDLRPLVVPLSLFTPSGTAKPDFSRFEMDDHGMTLRFGDYEAAADFVLYAVDPDPPGSTSPPGPPA